MNSGRGAAHTGWRSRLTRIVLVRHGQTEFNRTDRFRGRIDVALNETGLRQAEQAAGAVARRFRVSAIYSSPLARAMQTARTIGRATGVDVVSLPGILDYSYGEWEGKAVAEVEQAYPEQYHLFVTAPHRVEIPGGESMESFRSRLAVAVEHVAAAHLSETVVLVGHRMVCRVLSCYFLGLGNADLPRVDMETASISLFEKRPRGWTTLLLNDTCHLDG